MLSVCNGYELKLVNVIDFLNDLIFFIPPEPRDTGDIDWDIGRGGGVVGIGMLDGRVNAVLVVGVVEDDDYDTQKFILVLLLCVVLEVVFKIG